MSAIFLLLCVGCSNQIYQSKWTSHGDVPSSFRFYHPDSKIRYNIENDSVNLYVSFDVMDRQTIKKILSTGLRVFVDGTGKRKQRNEVQFPVYSDKVPIAEVNDLSETIDQMDRVGKHDLQGLIPTDGYLKFNGEVTPLFNGAVNNGVLVTMRFDSTSSLVYHATIPLAQIEELSDPMSLGFETGGYEVPHEDRSLSQADVTHANQGATPGDRAMGRGDSDPYGVNSPGGSTAAGMAMRNSTSYNKAMDPIRFWVKVKLGNRP